MKNKRLLITLLALVMLLLVGCQPNDETPNSDNSETQQQNNTQQEDNTQQNDTQLDINTEDTQLNIPSDIEDAVGTLSAERVEWFEKYYFNLPEKKNAKYVLRLC